MALPDPIRDVQFYEGVPLRRLVALCIDAAIITVATALFGLILGILTLGLALPLVWVFWVLFGVFYRFATIARYSATPGMMITGLELRQNSGERADQATALIHTLLLHAGFFFFPVFAIACAAMVLVGQVRLPHDLPLGTAVINRPA